MRSVSLTTTSARANAASGSPIEWVKATATFVPHSGWTRGLPGATASATSTTGGSASHATAIRWTASSAHARPSATTIATASPTYRARSRQRAHWEAGRWRAKERQRLHPAREIVEREDGGDAGERLRGNGIDPREPGVGVRRAQERRVEHPRERHVVDVARLAPQEPRVLPPPHRRAEIPGSHRASSTRLYIDHAGVDESSTCRRPPLNFRTCASQRGTAKDSGGRVSRVERPCASTWDRSGPDTP